RAAAPHAGIGRGRERSPVHPAHEVERGLAAALDGGPPDEPAPLEVEPAGELAQPPALEPEPEPRDGVGRIDRGELLLEAEELGARGVAAALEPVGVDEPAGLVAGDDLLEQRALHGIA